jgi:hypothetical protein
MSRELTSAEVRTLAEEIGLTKLQDEHLAQLLRATNAARARARSLKIEKLAGADEPSHVFSAKEV